MKDRLATTVAAIRETLFPPDPGMLRLFTALRATLGALLTLLLVVLLSTVVPTPAADRLLGFIIALFAGATVRDPRRRAQAITMALVPVVAIPASTAAALLLHHELMKDAVVPAIIFAATYGAARGPRWGTLGLIALIAYIVGLVTELPPSTLPVRCIVICLAAADAALLRLVLLPEHPAAELRRLLHDARRGIIRLLAGIDAALANGAWRLGGRHALQRALDNLATTILMVQVRLPALAETPPGLGLHMLETELVVERLVRTALQDLGRPGERGALRQTVATLQAALTTDREPPPLPEQSGGLAGALGLLARVLREHPVGPAPAPLPAQPPSAGLSPAIQSAIAATLAIIGGELISPTRWYWAAFAAFITFQGTRSRGESIAKVMQFMAGTLAGVVGGVFAAVLLSGHTGLTLTLIVVAVFLAFQAAQAAYGMMVFWITIILGLLFGMLGYFAPELLLLRLKETAVGAGCGVLVASAIMVRPTYAVADAAMAALLRAIRRTVDAAAQSLLDGTPDPNLPSALIELQSRFMDLRTAVRPELQGLGATRHAGLRQRLVLLEGCQAWTRELGRICLDTPKPDDPALVQTARATAARIDARLADLARGSLDDPVPGDPELSVGLAQGDLDSPPVRLLIRIEAALSRLARQSVIRSA